MKRKVVTPNAQRLIEEIGEFIYRDNPAAAFRYIEGAQHTFFDLPDELIPAQASEKLPAEVRKVTVKGFKGYMLYLAYLDDVVALIAAFRPGLSDRSINQRVRKGFREFKAME